MKYAGIRVLTFLTLIVGGLAVWPGAKPDASDARPLGIYYIDVEGGAATLIVTPAGESILVDDGWPDRDARDAKRIVATAKKAGLNRIDYLWITHYHTDHFGGTKNLMELFPVGKVLDHGPVNYDTTKDDANYTQLYPAYLKSTEGKRQVLRPGEKIVLNRSNGSASISLTVLTSAGDAISKPGPKNPECRDAKLNDPDPTDNARSAGFLLTLGNFRFLDLGDLTWNVEQKLVCSSNAIGRVTLYQVTHHGANISGNPALLKSIRPQVAIMNNGARKAGDPETYARLRALPSLQVTYQLHRNLATTDADNAPPEFIANLGEEAGCPGNTITVSVASDGSRYTVTNGRTGQARTFTTPIN
jgi:beta-lactamase superfamily II metal-dependent hydrolase